MLVPIAMGLCCAEANRQNAATQIETTTMAVMAGTPRKTLPPGIAKVLKRLVSIAAGFHDD